MSEESEAPEAWHPMRRSRSESPRSRPPLSQPPRSQPAALSGDDPFERLEALERRRRADDAERLRIIGALDAAAADEMGRRALRAELAQLLGMTEVAAEKLMSQARQAVFRYPAMLEALGAGAISSRHVAVILDAGRIIEAGAGSGADPGADAADENELAERCRAYERAVLDRAVTMTSNRLKQPARRLAEAWTAAPIEVRHEHARTERRVFVIDGEDGMADLVAHLPVVEAYAILDRLTRIAKSGKNGERIIPIPGGTASGDGDAGEMPDRPDTAPAPEAPPEHAAHRDGRSQDQVRADALVDLLLASDPFRLASGCPAEAIDARIQLIAPIDLTGSHTGNAGTETVGSGSRSGTSSTETGTGRIGAYAGAADLLGELAGYGPISSRDLLEHAARATRFERVETNPATGEVLSVDRYRPSERMRRVLAARDRHCRFPGCRVPVHRCDLDHTVDAAKGGPTSTDNLAHLCRSHHMLKHGSDWNVEQDDRGALAWSSPTGRSYVDRPPGMHEPPLRRRIPRRAPSAGEEAGHPGPSTVRFEPALAGPETAPAF